MQRRFLSVSASVVQEVWYWSFKTELRCGTAVAAEGMALMRQP
jgi:hypothetical protein